MFEYTCSAKDNITLAYFTSLKWAAELKYP